MNSAIAPEQSALIAGLQKDYGLDIASLRFLPLGNDPYARVYEGRTTGGASWFVKSRYGAVTEALLSIPQFLTEKGIPNILAPLPARNGELFARIDGATVVVYPFLQGDSAMRLGLTDGQWIEFGSTLRAVHDCALPQEIQSLLTHDTFSLPSANLVENVLHYCELSASLSGVAATFAVFLGEQAALLRQMIARSRELGEQLASRSFPRVLCHSDIHAANILVTAPGAIYLVDWDGPLFAPRERDLLFVVGSHIARIVEPREESLFFQGYGAVSVDPDALSYYRYERILEDISAAGEIVFENSSATEDTKRSEVDLAQSLFAPGNIIEATIRDDV